MSAPKVPAWVIAKLTTLLAEGKDRFIIAGLISASGFPCTARQVKRWKEKHALRQQWRASDDDLDAVVPAPRTRKLVRHTQWSCAQW